MYASEKINELFGGNWKNEGNDFFDLGKIENTIHVRMKVGELEIEEKTPIIGEVNPHKGINSFKTTLSFTTTNPYTTCDIELYVSDNREQLKVIFSQKSKIGGVIKNEFESDFTK